MRAAALHILRNDKGLTQKQVADGVGLSKQAISKFEQGIGFSVDTALKLAKFFNVEPDYFIKESAKQSNISKKNKDKIRLAKMEALILHLENKVAELESKVKNLEERIPYRQ